MAADMRLSPLARKHESKRGHNRDENEPIDGPDVPKLEWPDRRAGRRDAIAGDAEMRLDVDQPLADGRRVAEKPRVVESGKRDHGQTEGHERDPTRHSAWERGAPDQYEPGDQERCKTRSRNALEVLFTLGETLMHRKLL
ncbi:MAG: hypothetical protein AAGI17_02460 [Planctomycetota bacterium]